MNKGGTSRPGVTLHWPDALRRTAVNRFPHSPWVKVTPGDRRLAGMFRGPTGPRSGSEGWKAWLDLHQQPQGLDPWHQTAESASEES